MLKCDLHIHTKEDKTDRFIKHSVYDIIDLASENKFDVLAFTFHNQYFYPKKIIEYAKNKNILLIPGIEKEVEGKEVLIYNVKPAELNKIKTLKDLKKIKRANTLIVAPHPYFPKKSCLNHLLEEYIDCFDAIELCHLYQKFVDFNKNARWASLKYNKPLVANSDTHHIKNVLGTNYTMVKSKKTITGVIKAIKNNNINIITKPMRSFNFIVEGAWLVKQTIFYK